MDDNIFATFRKCGPLKKATVIAFQGKLQSMGTTPTGVLSQATTCSTVEDITTDAIQQ